MLCFADFMVISSPIPVLHVILCSTGFICRCCGLHFLGSPNALDAHILAETRKSCA